MEIRASDALKRKRSDSQDHDDHEISSTNGNGSGSGSGSASQSENKQPVQVQIHKRPPEGKFKKLKFNVMQEIKDKKGKHALNRVVTVKKEPIDSTADIKVKKEDTKDEKRNFKKVKKIDLRLPPGFKMPAGFLPPPIKNKTLDCLNQDLDLFLWTLKVDEQKKGPPPHEDKFDPSRVVPVLQAVCITEQGETLLAWIHGFKPYFFAKVPSDIVDQLQDEHGKERVCEELRSKLELEMSQHPSTKHVQKPLVVNVTIEDGTTLLYYQFDKKVPYFKITIVLPNLLNAARNKLAGISDENFPPSLHYAMSIWGQVRIFEVFDCNFAFPLKFLIDVNGQGCGWMTLPKGTYTQRESKYCRHLFDVELDCHYKSLITHDALEGGRWGLIPSLTVVSFDIECAGAKGRFPCADVDPIILISCVLFKTPKIQIKGIETDDKKTTSTTTSTSLVPIATTGNTDSKNKEVKEKKEKEEKNEKNGKDEKEIQEKEQKQKEIKEPPSNGGQINENKEKKEKKEEKKEEKSLSIIESQMIKCVFSIKPCDPLDGTEILGFNGDEVRMLTCFLSFLRFCGHHLLTGYNISNFDIPFIINRCKTLGVPHYEYWTRILSPTTAKKNQFNSKATGSQARVNIHMPGVLSFDMYRIIVGDHKLGSYTLNAVCFHFLKQIKDDVHHSQITPLYETGGPAGMRRLAKYCVKDSILPILLMQKLAKLINFIGYARVTGLLIDILIERGQGVKTASLLARICLPQRFKKPFVPRSEMAQTEGQKKMEGATVQEAKRRFYIAPIATLDFASLYPSLVMAHNLSYDTLIHKDDVDKIPACDRTTVTIGNKTLHFVKAHIRRGTMCIILERLLKARSHAKDEMAKAEESGDKDAVAIFDGNQLALKICANSVFGFFAGFDFPCADIGATVTYFGRQSIEKVKKHIETNFKKGMTVTCTIRNKDGSTKTLTCECEEDAEIVYGDTDSVMCKFGMIELFKVMILANIAGYQCTGLFTSPMKLTFEKVYYPYLLMQKKRYAGLYFEPNTSVPKKKDSKGMENVRRDNPEFLRNTINTLLTLILEKRDVQAAIDFVKQQVLDLLAGKISISLLVITKSIAKADYKSKPLQVALAERIEKRAPGTGPTVGSRLGYVLIGGNKKDKMDKKIEEASFVVDNEMQPDYSLYIERQMKRPISRLMFFPYLYLLESQGKPLPGQIVNQLGKQEKKLNYYEYLSSLDKDKLDDLMMDTMSFLFAGRFTATKTKTNSIQGPLASIMKPVASCLGCKTSIPSRYMNPNKKDITHVLCTMCLKKEQQNPSIFLREMDKLRTLQDERHRIWSWCRTCVEDRYGQAAETCSNNECILFYRRKLVIREEEAQRKKMNMFEF